MKKRYTAKSYTYLRTIRAKAKQILKKYDEDPEEGYKYLVRALIGSARRANRNVPIVGYDSDKYDKNEKAQIASSVAHSRYNRTKIIKEQQDNFYDQAMKRFERLEDVKNK